MRARLLGGIGKLFFCLRIEGVADRVWGTQSEQFFGLAGGESNPPPARFPEKVGSPFG